MCTETATNNLDAPSNNVLATSCSEETFVFRLKDSPEMIGQEIDCKKRTSFHEHYKLREILGKGTFGKVYKCIEEKSERCFAVKKVTISNEEIGKDLEREVSIWKELKHANVVLLHSTFSEGGVAHLVMEYVEGKSLFDEMLLQIMYTEKEACAVLKQIFQALEYLHTRRIVHRDVKGDNIILTRCTRTNDITVKLLDFGLARKLPRDSDVINCDVEGAPLFLAPETILEDPIGCAVDLWSCGVICFLLLVGYPPFWDDDDDKLFSQIRRGRYSMVSLHWDEVSDDAKDLVKRTLVTSPCKRVTATKALKHPWFDILLEEGTH